MTADPHGVDGIFLGLMKGATMVLKSLSWTSRMDLADTVGPERTATFLWHVQWKGVEIQAVSPRLS